MEQTNILYSLLYFINMVYFAAIKQWKGRKEKIVWKKYFYTVFNAIIEKINKRQ